MSLVLEYPTLRELRTALEGFVSPALLFLSGHTEVELGERTSVVLHAEREGLRIPVGGLVTWRYPEGRVPPGRIAGVGILLDAETRELPLFRSIIEGLPPLVPPGGRLPAMLQAAADDDTQDGDGPEGVEDFDGITGSFDFLDDSAWAGATEIGPSVDDRTSDISMEAIASDEEFSGEQTLSTRELAEQAEKGDAFLADKTSVDAIEILSKDFLPVSQEATGLPHVRALPESDLWPTLPVPLLSGRAFVYPGGRSEPDQVTSFGWPTSGTQRSTWFEKQRESGRSVDEIFSSTANDFDENTDPARAIDAVSRATADASPPKPSFALPVALFARRDKASPPLSLFEAGAILPTEASLKLKAPKDALHLEVEVLAERWGEPGHDLVGVARFALAEDAQRAQRARFHLDARGAMTIHLAGDEKAVQALETGIVPVPVRGDTLAHDRGLLTTIKKLFRSE